MKSNRSYSFFAIFISLVIAVAPSMNAFAGTDWLASKSATDLTQDGRSTVTFALPGSSSYENTKVDAVFVLDNSNIDKSSLNAEVTKVLGNLANNSNVDLKVGVVVFDGWGHDAYSLSKSGSDTLTGLVQVDSNSIADISDAISFDLRNSAWRLGASNSEQPLRLAKTMLTGPTSRSDAKKIVCLLSDFGTYVYGENVEINGVQYTDIPMSKDTSLTTWGDRSNNGTCSLWTPPSDYTTWAELYSDYMSGALTSSSLWDKDAFFRTGSWDTFWGKGAVASMYSGSEPVPTFADEQAIISYKNANWAMGAPANGEKQINGRDKSYIKTYEIVEDLKSMGTTVMMYQLGGQDIAKEFTSAMATDGSSAAYSDDGTSLIDYLADFQQTIVQLFNSGTLTDVVGNQFDLVLNGASTFTVAKDGVPVTGVQISDTEWGFGNQNSNGVYDYVIKYTNGDQETIDVAFNVPVLNDEQLTISYDVEINEGTQTGDYPTNESAVLNYVSSNGNPGQFVFKNPIVHYEAPGVALELLPAPDSGNPVMVATGDNNNIVIGLASISVVAAIGVLGAFSRIRKCR